MIEQDIANAIKDKIDTVPEVKTILFDKVKLATGEFRDHEIPAVQLWDVAQEIQHERGRMLVNWRMVLELIMKPTKDGAVSQQSLWDLRRKIALALWERPNLGIPGVVHLIYVSNETDLHLLAPFYVARIEFIVQYYDQLTGTC